MAVPSQLTSIFDNLEDDEEVNNQPPEVESLSKTPVKPILHKVIPYNTLLSSSLLNASNTPSHVKPQLSFPIPKKLKSAPLNSTSMKITTKNDFLPQSADNSIGLFPEFIPPTSTPLKRQAELLRHKPREVSNSLSSSMLSVLPPPSKPSGLTTISFLKPISKLNEAGKNINLNKQSLKGQKEDSDKIKLEKSYNTEIFPSEDKIDRKEKDHSNSEILNISKQKSNDSAQNDISKMISMDVNNSDLSPDSQSNKGDTATSLGTIDILERPEKIINPNSLLESTYLEQDETNCLSGLLSGYSDDDDEVKDKPEDTQSDREFPFSVTSHPPKKWSANHQGNKVAALKSNFEISIPYEQPVNHKSEKIDTIDYEPVIKSESNLDTDTSITDNDPFFPYAHPNDTNFNTNDEFLIQTQHQTHLPPPAFTQPQSSHMIVDSLNFNPIINSSMPKKSREWKAFQNTDVYDISAKSLQNPNWYMDNKIRNEPLYAGTKKYTLPTRVWSANDGASITVAEPRKLQKQKHQINWLAKEAHEREAEINSITARARQHKYDARLKYGW